MIKDKVKPATRTRATAKKSTTKIKTAEKVESTEIAANPVFIETGDSKLMVMSNGTELSRSDFFVTGGDIDNVLKSIKEEVSSYVPDITTAKGRAAITKTVSIVTSCKTYLEAQGKDLSAEYKSIPGKIDKNRAKVKEFLTDLQAEIRKPLTDWQEEQAKIKAEQEEKEAAEKLLAEIESCHELALLMDEKFDHEIQLEIARLKQEQIDNDALIAKEATIEAERLAKEKIDNAKAAEQKAIDDKIKADNDLIESQANEKYLEEQAEETRLNNEWLEYISEAYQINAEIDAEAESKRQQDLAEENRLASIKTERLAGIERQRLAQIKLDDEAKARAADTKNKSRVNNAILSVLIANGIDEEVGKAFIRLAAKNQLPQLIINY